MFLNPFQEIPSLEDFDLEPIASNEKVSLVNLFIRISWFADKLASNKDNAT
jgi:hypothetical protein